MTPNGFNLLVVTLCMVLLTLAVGVLYVGQPRSGDAPEASASAKGGNLPDDGR